jgi:shikimate dehydrogenase
VQQHLNHIKNLYGLIGFPLSHSFSKGYFAEKFKKENIHESFYEVFPIPTIALFPDLVERCKNLKGLNVTIPYKEQVMSYLDAVDPEAQAIGAVNTIKFENGKMTGYNSDVWGFEKSLLPMLHPDHLHALILGTGGASKAVAYVLNKLGITYHFVSRGLTENTIAYEALTPETIRHTKLIINTSPVGMYPNVDTCPDIPYEYIGDHHLLYDLIYNPEETLFLRKGKERGAATKNGLEMLALQAERSWQIWNDL